MEVDNCPKPWLVILVDARSLVRTARLAEATLMRLHIHC